MCVCVYMYIYMCIYVYLFMYLCICVCVCVCVACVLSGLAGVWLEKIVKGSAQVIYEKIYIYEKIDR